MKDQKIPPVVNVVVDELARKYSESPATTGAGGVLRFFARFVTLNTLIKIIVHKKASK